MIELIQKRKEKSIRPNTTMQFFETDYQSLFFKNFAVDNPP